MTDFIIDASVVAKWVVEEPGSEKAERLISSRIFLRAPELIVPELANVLWKKTARGELKPHEAATCLEVLLADHMDVTVHLVPSRLFVRTALEIAQSTGRSVYDSVYLAAAVQAHCKFITADERFVRSLKDPVLKAHAMSLNDADLE